MAAPKPVVLVTGASRGIGLAVTKTLLHAFAANVVAISRSTSPELTQLASSSLLSIECDVTDEPAVAVAIAAAITRFQAIDGLILNAGVLEPLCRIGDDTPLDSWKNLFDVNFFSLVTALKLTLPYLRASAFGGRVVFVSSGAAIKGNAGWGPYSASKAAMNSICRTLADEESEVTTVAVRPGMVDTQMQLVLRETGEASMMEKEHRHFIRAHAEGKLVHPDDCGYVIAALSLQCPSCLNGQFVSWNSEECQAFRRQEK